MYMYVVSRYTVGQTFLFPALLRRQTKEKDERRAWKNIEKRASNFFALFDVLGGKWSKPGREQRGRREGGNEREGHVSVHISRKLKLNLTLILMYMPSPMLDWDSECESEKGHNIAEDFGNGIYKYIDLVVELLYKISCKVKKGRERKRSNGV